MKEKVKKSRKSTTVKRQTDFISNLPSSILHHILSYLGSKDSVTTSALSKQWNSVWKSFPILKFGTPSGFDESSPVMKERFREYLYSVDRCLQNFIQNERRIETLNLDVCGVHKSSVPLVNTWLPLALHNDVSDLRFDVSINGKYPYPLPETTFTINSLLLRGSSNCFRLKKLELCGVSLTKKIVQDIIHNCPDLTDLCLLSTEDLQTLRISELYKLVNLTIEVTFISTLKSVVVDVCSLKRFSIVFDEQEWPCKVDLTSCYNLREFSLNKSSIADSLFNQQISRFSLLEVLKIECCHDLRRIRIPLPRLKHLHLECCHFEAIEIDAPVLSEFVFTRTSDSGEWPVLVSAHAIPSSLELFYEMEEDYEGVNSFWFLKIRKFVSVPFKSTTFELVSHDSLDEISFNLDELRECVIPPPVEIDRLDLSDTDRPSYNWEAFLDGLLWSCHPKEIYTTASLSPTSCDEDNCIKVLCRMLNESECKLCCNLPHCMCWRRRFKAATIESTRGIKFDEINVRSVTRDLFLKPKYRRGRSRAKENLNSDQMWCSVTFRFDWEN